MKNQELISLRYLVVDHKGKIFWDSHPPNPGEANFLFSEERSPLPFSEIFRLKQTKCYTAKQIEVGVFIEDLGKNLGEDRFLMMITSLDEVLLSRQAAAHIRLRSTIGSLIAGFAHEVRNPIAAIVSLVDLALVYSESDSELTQILAKIPPLLFRIEQLLRSTLNYGRPKSPRASWHQLLAMLDGILESMNLAGTKLSRENWIIPTNDIPVFADSDHMTSIITNLLTNALQATSDPNGVRVEIQLHEKANYVILDVIDNGSGVPSDIQEKIFEPFFTTKPKGTGLGLALARDLARINKGDLVLLHTSPQGSTFRLSILCRPKEADR